MRDTNGELGIGWGGGGVDAGPPPQPESARMMPRKDIIVRFRSIRPSFRSLLLKCINTAERWGKTVRRIGRQMRSTSVEIQIPPNPRLKRCRILWCGASQQF